MRAAESQPESIIVPATHETTALVFITAANVTVDGFTVDGGSLPERAHACDEA